MHQRRAYGFVARPDKGVTRSVIPTTMRDVTSIDTMIAVRCRTQNHLSRVAAGRVGVGVEGSKTGIACPVVPPASRRFGGFGVLRGARA